MKTLPQRPRFLICRLSAIGDTVHTLPLANLIKRHWPDAYVAWVVEKAASPLVLGHPAVDETIVAPKGFLRSPREMWQLSKQLRALKIDVALDPQSLSKSAVCAMLSGAKKRIGFTKPFARELAPLLNSSLVSPLQTHVVDRYLEMLRPLGAVPNSRDIGFGLRNDKAADGAIASFLHSHGAANFAVINPGAGWDSKIWPAERFAAVARALPVVSVVVWAGEREKAWAQEIVATSDGKALLAPVTSLLELVALTRRANLFIGSDTGPLHIAAAVGTPCVAIYGPTDAAVCGPYGSGHVVLQTSLEDLGSARKARGLVSNAMLEVSAEEVATACCRVLKAKPRQFSADAA